MTNNKKPLKILFFANIPTNDKRSIGGATVLANKILYFVQKSDKMLVKHQQIRRFWKPKVQIIDYIFWLVKFPFLIRKYDVISFHATKDINVTIAPLLWFMAKWQHKKIVYHLFNGDFHLKYQNAPGFIRKIWTKTVLQSDTLFLETKTSIQYFEKLGYSNIRWLPNSRKVVKNTHPRKHFSRKFVFISRVLPDKGIPEIIAATQMLPDDYQVDVYGPIDDKYYTGNPFTNTKVNYKGQLNPDEVMDTLNKYDVLLLPTYIKTEGYPGIIIEALSLGIPVITTQCCVMFEMINDRKNGLLIKPQSAEDLKKAILEFNADNYMDFSHEALQSFSNFDSDIVFQKIVKAYLQ